MAAVEAKLFDKWTYSDVNTSRDLPLTVSCFIKNVMFEN